jgi:hypothetical protein
VHEDEVGGADQQREQCHAEVALGDDQTNRHGHDCGGPNQVVEARGLARRIAVEVAGEGQDQTDLGELRRLDAPAEEPTLTPARHGREDERRGEQQRAGDEERQREPLEMPVVDRRHHQCRGGPDAEGDELAPHLL